MSLGDVVLGLLNGLTIGLLAVGLVLVYKSNKFLNLAHAQLGAISALLVAKWVLDAGWNWWLAFAVALVIGAVTGLLVERFLVAPLRRRTKSTVRLLLLTLGISQLLLGVTYIPHLRPDPGKGNTYPQPFDSDIHVGGVVLTGMYVLTAIIVPVLVVALALFMKYSFFGKQVRAAANNEDAARLCGISVGKVSALTWGLAGLFSAVSAVLQAPTQSSFDSAALGPYLLMLTLGAAAAGSFVSLPWALAGGLLIGLVQQLTAVTTSGPTSELVVFALILAIVFARGRSIAGAFAVSGGDNEGLPPLRVPAPLRDSPLVRFQTAWLGLAALVVAIAFPHLPYFSSEGNRYYLCLVLVYTIVGIALTMLIGWGGQISLGHFAIVGVGAYLTARWSTHGISLPALCLLVGLIGAATMAVVGLPALRVRGLALAVTTLGFAVIAPDWLFQQAWFATDQSFGLLVEHPRIGAGLGTPTSKLDIYYVGLVLIVLALAAAAALRRSGAGRLILAVRDNERASSAFGVNPGTVKLAVLAVSGFYAGVAGVLWASAWEQVTLRQFTPDVSIAAIAIPVIGGLGSLAGAAAAGVMLYGTALFVSPHLNSFLGDYGNGLAFILISAGLAQIGFLLFAPEGLAGIARNRWQAYLDRRARHQLTTQYAGDPEIPLQVWGVTVRFGGVVALDSPDIKVQPGEIVGLIGTNGAGKTTLMNVISGVITPERGSVALFGHEVVDLAPDFRAAYGLARSFQDASLFAGLTVVETIQVALAHRNKVGVLSAMVAAPWVRANERRTRREAEELVERFGLETWADTRTSELSTGTRRICDLAAQVAAKPKLLLLDEPTAGVAQREAEAFGPLLRRVRDELDCAVLIVEHDMPLLMGLCDRVYAMESGTVIAEGTPGEIRDNPRVVESYLGTSDTAIGRSGSGTTRTTKPRSKRASRPAVATSPASRRRAQVGQPSPRRAQ